MALSLDVLGLVFELALYTRNGERLPSALWLRVGERTWWVEGSQRPTAAD